jgi:predicted membrane protein
MVELLGGDREMKQSRIIIGVLIILIGLNFLFNLNLVRIIIAGFIIWLGLRVIMGSERRFDYSEQTEAEEDKVDRVLVFSGINKKFISSNFQGTNIVAVFGGGEIDLSDVKTKEKEVILEFTAVFGGLKVILPKSWAVKSEGVGIIGGFDNKTKLSGKKTVDVKLKGAAILGGVEIVN